jgi:hypothetical protein
VPNVPQHHVGLPLDAPERAAVHRKRQLARRVLKTDERLLYELSVDQVELRLLVRCLYGVQQLGGRVCAAGERVEQRVGDVGGQSAQRDRLVPWREEARRKVRLPALVVAPRTMLLAAKRPRHELAVHELVSRLVPVRRHEAVRGGQSVGGLVAVICHLAHRLRHSAFGQRCQRTPLRARLLLLARKLRLVSRRPPGGSLGGSILCVESHVVARSVHALLLFLRRVVEEALVLARFDVVGLLFVVGVVDVDFIWRGRARALSLPRFGLRRGSLRLACRFRPPDSPGRCSASRALRAAPAPPGAAALPALHPGIGRSLSRVNLRASVGIAEEVDRLARVDRGCHARNARRGRRRERRRRERRRRERRRRELQSGAANRAHVDAPELSEGALHPGRVAREPVFPRHRRRTQGAFARAVAPKCERRADTRARRVSDLFKAQPESAKKCLEMKARFFWR